MIRTLSSWLIATGLLLYSCSTVKSVPDNILSKKEKKEGWQLLFDGQGTRGWHRYGGAPAGKAWRVADGILLLDTTEMRGGKIIGGGDLVTDEEFSDFHLKLEWKIAPKGNSGIMFYVQEDTLRFKESYNSGPEMQVLDNAGHSDGADPKHRAGALYDLVACSKETVKPAGAWNKAEIRCVNGQLDCYLNGENVVSLKLWDDAWEKMVAASKFHEWPGFGTFKKGRIVLQDHDSQVQYRNIKIRRL